MYRTLALQTNKMEVNQPIFSIDQLKEAQQHEWRGHKTSKKTLLICSIILIVLTGLLAGWVFIAKPRFYPKLGLYSRSADDVWTDSTIKKEMFNKRTKRSIASLPQKKQFQVINLNIEKEFPINNSRLPPNLIPQDYFIDLNISLNSNYFNGSVTILFNCIKKTNMIIFHGRKINLQNVSIFAKNGELTYKRVIYIKRYELFVIELDQYLEEEKLFELDLTYSVVYGKSLAGLYKSNYTSHNGTQRTIVSTHFEPTDARSAFPCFDEPHLKARFFVSITHDATLTALSNMPVNKTIIVDKNTVKDEFEPSVKMSTYLVAFSVNDFKYKEKKTKSGKRVRVYARETDFNRIDYAVMAATAIIDFYEQLFEAKYPLPKLDLLAVPDFMAGAMEDWGLVSFRSAYLVFDEEIMTVESMRQVTLVIAHELAHQWFGNLVTMKWWNDIWLNEGFANYVEMLGTDIVNSQFHAIDMQVPTGWQAAISSDSLKNSHPVSQDVKSTSEIDEMFDAISYNKGASLLRMIEGFMKEKMIKGVRSYIDHYQYSNAETDDLWKHLTNASGELNIKSIMDTWTRQRSFPVVTMIRKPGSKFKIQQESFLEMKQKIESPNSTCNQTDGLWQIPFTYITDQSFVTQTYWLKDRDAEIDLDSTVMWVKANIDSRGFYLVNYDNETWRALQQQLVNNHKAFSDVNRAGILHDVFKLSCEEILDPIVALNITKYLSKERDFIPWAMARSKSECIAMMIQDHSVKRKFKKYFWSLMSHLVKPSMLDYNGKKEEKLSIYERLQRLETFSFALKHNVSSEFQKKVSLIFNDMAAGKKLVGLSPENRALALMYGYNSSNENDWDFLWKLYEKSEVDTDRKIIMKALAQFKEKNKINYILEKSLNKSIMRVQDTIPLLANIVRLGSRKEVWDFVCINYDSFKERYGGGYQLGQLLGEVASGFSTWVAYKEVRTFFKKHPIGAKGSRTEKQILEKIKNNIHRHTAENINIHGKRISFWLEEEVSKRNTLNSSYEFD
ncbi:endoplasmic reticulum aminopeptidase 1 isoform X1 [Hydra vulgaris]|uniref:Endoplasmic reticulum aminopeptidase 1 isoform X1 n=2 Tax=Hydra vulgaris TaxID=6087 RepID=A0ABM4D882_HYDVU